MKLYIIREKKGVSATAEYDQNKRDFVVLKDSKVSSDISSAPTFRGAKSVQILREKYVTDGIVQENVHFRSSSTAANFVTGNSTDGPSTWKDKSGKTLKTIMNEVKE